jgi:hypothetical protein
MATTNKKAMSIGIFLAISFFGVLALIFSPIFGDGKNGLEFSDDLFNKLSKGSSYFIPKIMKDSEKFLGKSFDVTIKLEKPELAEKSVKVLNAAGAKAEASGLEIKISADLGSLMLKILKDSDNMYKNDGHAVSGIYGFDEKEVMVTWWNILKPLDKELKKAGKVEEAKIVSDVMKKAVETTHNFYNIDAQKVTEKAGLMTVLLVFYVAYTMWWGFAIFYIFEGIGLTMKKAKVKKEV